MKRFSIGRSIGDGFDLIARRPLSVFMWGLVMIAPSLAAVALIFPAMSDIFASMPAEGASDAAAEAAFDKAMFANIMQMQLASLLANVVQLLTMAVAYTAVLRAVLRPRETSFFSLRIGMDELRVAVVGLAIVMGLYAAMIVVVLLAAAIGFAMWAIDPTLMWVVMAVLGVALVVALFWALARVSLIAPASVLRRDFAFAEGWKLAAGKGWPLLGMMVIILLVILVIEMVLLLGAVALVAGALGQGGVWLEPDANPFIGFSAWLRTNWYWAALAGVATCWFYGFVAALSLAPFASACRQLVDSSAPPPAPAADEAGSPG